MESKETNKGLTLFNLGENYLQFVNEIEEKGGELTTDLEVKMNEILDLIIAKQNGYLVVSKKFDKKIEEAKDYIGMLQGVVKTYEFYQKRLKDRMLDFMKRTGLTDLEGLLGKVKLMKSKKVPEWVTVEHVPDEFKRTEIVISLKKAELKKALEEGIKVGNIELEENEYIRIYEKRKLTNQGDIK